MSKQAVEEWHGARELAADFDKPTETSGRVNQVTGVALIALSLVLLVGSCSVADGSGGVSLVVAFGPFIYGCMRLAQASDQKRASRERAASPYR